MEPKAPIGISVTTYEISQGQYNPTLTHIFWGQDINQALSYAKSHLISDYFFSASFVGQMRWRGSILQLSNEGGLIREFMFSSNQEVAAIMANLNREAQKVVDAQYKSGLVQVVEMLSLAQPSQSGY